MEGRQNRSMDHLPPPIDLERLMPERNMARFYRLDVERDLFGVILARRTWGRIGTFGQSLVLPCPTVSDARAELERLERLKRRRGYSDRNHVKDTE